MKKLIALVSTLLISSIYGQAIIANDHFVEVPTSLDPKKIYVFYLHGSAEEQGGDTDKYDSAVAAIEGGKIVVISEVRGVTVPNEYANKLKSQVEKLQRAGVPKKNITISGYSKGAVIALAAAGAIQDPEIKYVLLAGCSETLNRKYSVDSSKVKGKVLAIYDKDDEKYGSCKEILKNSGGLLLEEKVLNSGKGHALFHIAKEKFTSQWSYPLKKWAN